MDFSAMEGVLKENQEIITELIKEQNVINYTPDIEKFQKLYNNISSLVKIADLQPDTLNLLYHHYTPLSKGDLQRVLHEERSQETFAGEFYNLMLEDTYKRNHQKVQKKSRAECRWTEEEEEKFLEALEIYGEKRLTYIAEHIGTRNKIQVRSHLEKYKLKLQKQVKIETLVNT